jgi:hypothetical protein
MNEQTMYCRQIYVDKNRPWDAQIIPDVYENFYSPVQQDDAQADRVDKMETLESEIASLREQMALRDKQIESFSKMLKRYGPDSAPGFDYAAGYATDEGYKNSNNI